MSYLRVVKPNEPAEAVSDPAITYSFPLDPFQQHAISAISRRENVLVTAKTGSGKTLVGEYQIAESLRRGGRVFYTTPIKSLSNQKFYDLKKMFPERVGIMTGDIKFKPDADIVIMTTEILRNLLFKRNTGTAHIGITAALSTDRLDAVVFDECHYINDKDRGAVWEETLILLPREVNLILLSATIDAPEMFGQWLGELKQKPVHLISTEYRIVPLVHGVYKGDEFVPVMDHRDRFDAAAYNAWLRWNSQQEKTQTQHRQRVDDRRRGGYEDAVITGGSLKKSFLHEMNGMIGRLADAELLPAIFFVFSRKDCERYAGSVEHSLLDSSDVAAMHHIMDFHLHRYGEGLQQMQQYHTLRALLDKGVAYHHSGLLPVLKEIVEILFGRGYIKVLFATETFAVGINMPTKSVVFTGFRKYDDTKEGLRLLTTDEYIQMAGRAGRRGKDVRGNVIYLPSREPESLDTMKRMMTGSQTTFQSRMTFYYDFLLKTLHTGNTRWMDVMKQSYWSCKQTQKVEASKRDLAACIQEKERLGVTPEQIVDMKQLDEISCALKSSGNAERKKVQRELETWKQRHMGPVWWKLEKEIWKKYTTLAREEMDIQKDIEFLETDSLRRVESTLNALREYGFLDGDVLTPLGTLASEVNEGHPILMPLFYSKSRELLQTREELLTFLAFFLPASDEATTECSLLPEAKKALISLANTCMEVERDNSIISPKPAYWSIHTGHVEMIWRLVNGETITQLCYDYDIFEGNIMRVLSSMLHLLEEWRNMATLSNDTRTLEMLVDAEACITTSWSIGDSIYLRL